MFTARQFIIFQEIQGHLSMTYDPEYITWKRQYIYGFPAQTQTSNLEDQLNTGRNHHMNGTFGNSTQSSIPVAVPEESELTEEHKRLFDFMWLNYGPSGIALNVAIISLMSLLTMVLMNKYRKSLIKYEQNKIYGFEFDY